MNFGPATLETTANQWRQLCIMSEQGNSTTSDLGLYARVPGGYKLVGMRVSAKALDELLAAQQGKADAERKLRELEAEVERMKGAK